MANRLLTNFVRPVLACSTRRYASGHVAISRQPLAEVDPDMAAIIKGEKGRQQYSKFSQCWGGLELGRPQPRMWFAQFILTCLQYFCLTLTMRSCHYCLISYESPTALNLIASENYTASAVAEAVGSVMSNKYSEGYPGARYYGGNEFIDQAEILCQQRALAAFHLNPDEWAVNVQALSGSPANFAVYTAIMGPGGRLMGLDLPHGGHLSHGFQTATTKVSATSKYFVTMPYRLDEDSGLIDYEQIDTNAQLFRPDIIVAGISAYSRELDYASIRATCDKVGAHMLADMAHISGLVSAQVVKNNPFDYADVVTTTTHKSLRGPRGALIFTRKGKGLEKEIDQAVFPGHQGGPHNHTICGLAVALKLAAMPEFKDYQRQVISNSQTLASELESKGHIIVSGGTDNHMFVANTKASHGACGSRVDHIADLAGISLNKNTVPGDKSAMTPSGIRVGTPALTTRGLNDNDFKHVAELLDRSVRLAVDLKSKVDGKKIKDFTSQVTLEAFPEIQELRKDVTEFGKSFPTIGFEESDLL